MQLAANLIQNENRFLHKTYRFLSADSLQSIIIIYSIYDFTNFYAHKFEQFFHRTYFSHVVKIKRNQFCFTFGQITSEQKQMASVHVDAWPNTEHAMVTRN